MEPPRAHPGPGPHGLRPLLLLRRDLRRPRPGQLLRSQRLPRRARPPPPLPRAAGDGPRLGPVGADRWHHRQPVAERHRPDRPRGHAAAGRGRWHGALRHGRRLRARLGPAHPPGPVRPAFPGRRTARPAARSREGRPAAQGRRGRRRQRSRQRAGPAARRAHRRRERAGPRGLRSRPRGRRARPQRSRGHRPGPRLQGARLRLPHGGRAAQRTQRRHRSAAPRGPDLRLPHAGGHRPLPARPTRPPLSSSTGPPAWAAERPS